MQCSNDAMPYDCWPDGSLKSFHSGKPSKFVIFSMMKGLLAVVSDYYDDVSNREGTAEDGLAQWFTGLAGKPNKGRILGASVLLLPGSLGWRIVNNKNRGLRRYLGAGKRFTKS